MRGKEEDLPYGSELNGGSLPENIRVRAIKGKRKKVYFLAASLIDFIDPLTGEIINKSKLSNAPLPPLYYPDTTID